MNVEEKDHQYRFSTQSKALVSISKPVNLIFVGIFTAGVGQICSRQCASLIHRPSIFQLGVGLTSPIWISIYNSFSVAQVPKCTVGDSSGSVPQIDANALVNHLFASKSQQ